MKKNIIESSSVSFYTIASKYGILCVVDTPKLKNKQTFIAVPSQQINNSNMDKMVKFNTKEDAQIFIDTNKKRIGKVKIIRVERTITTGNFSSSQN